MNEAKLRARRDALKAENQQRATFATPTEDCDIVMKGGITSGVVYPGAVLRLARRYRFRSIGGTSAGAIAAAVVAAAEHDRDAGSFTKVADLPDELAGETPDGKPFMLQMFQADRATRPLFDSIVGFMRHGKLRGIPGFLWRFPRAPLAALAVAAGSVVLSFVLGVDAAFAVAGVALAVPVLLAGLYLDVKRAFGCLAANHYGMCRLGPPDPGTTRPPALTEWLHGKIQDVAGVRDGGPLTFADLWGIPDATTDAPWSEAAREQALLERSRNPDARCVDLQVVTTDLTHGRPIRLPVMYQRHEPLLEEEAGRLLFDPDEMAAFFPADVVSHLVRFSKPLNTTRAIVEELTPPGKKLIRFPIGPDLPIVVATRMSLSFPFLISAIPLYRLEHLADGRKRIDRVVFSDGGVTSNFPIHFFDSPLPTRPTFGLNLTRFDRDEQPDLDDQADAVVPPGNPSAPYREVLFPIDGLGSFFGALKNAAQNWRDNSQAALPGYRDRIAHIKLDQEEGGLNLVMPEPTIRRMNDRGDFAGQELTRLFAAPPDGGESEHWKDHRFTRFRVTMGIGERWLRSFARGWDDAYRARVQAGRVAPYEFPSDQALEAALAMSEAYCGLVPDPQTGVSLDDRKTPRPPSTLRSVPPV